MTTDPANTTDRTDQALETVPDTVPCGFGCGYLADSEADLDAHEDQCEHAWSDLPAPQPTRSTRRLTSRTGGDRR